MIIEKTARLNLPAWVYITLAIPCAGAGVWASVVTLRYFVHGASALETDPAVQALAVAAALLLVVLGMSAFGLAALLTEAQLWARRWALSLFSGTVLVLEMVTIGAVQSALVVGAALSQASVVGDAADLEQQISRLEAQAAQYSATASALRVGNQLTLAKRTEDQAAAALAKTGALYASLSAARAAKRPTLTGMLGERAALVYVVVRGMLISLGGMVFLGVGGAMLRLGMQRHAPACVDAPVARPAPAPALAPAPAKPAPVALAQVQDAPQVWHYRRKEAGRVNLGAEPEIAPVAPTPAPAPVAPTQVQRVQEVRVQRVKRVQAAKVHDVPAGLLAAIKSGECKPAQKAIRVFAGCNQDVAKRHLSKLAADGVIEPMPGRAGWWQLKAKV